jgi:hypothetical protein
MEIDFSGLWAWTIPLWSLFLLVLFLVGVLNEPVIIEGILPATAVSATMTGGARMKKRVRFAI